MLDLSPPPDDEPLRITIPDLLDEHATPRDLILRELVRRNAMVEPLARAAFLATLRPHELAQIVYCWRAWARPSQLAPRGDWRFWLLCAGRGFGKSKTGAEFIRDEVEGGRARIVGLVGGTAADVRDVMIEGPAGILACTPRNLRPTWTPSRRKLTWPNGAYAITFSAEDPEALRGPQHDLVWWDEAAAAAYPKETLSNLDFGLRFNGPTGLRPRCLVTTTPRPIPTMRELMARKDIVVTRGATFDNAANLAAGALDSLLRQYEGTRLGRQELFAEMLDDVVGALWTRKMIDDALRIGATMSPEFALRTVVGVDPPANDGKDTEEGAEAGIVTVSTMPPERTGGDIRFLVVDDASGHASPKEWGTRAVEQYRRWKADKIIAEANMGGEMVRSTIKNIDPNVPVDLVHASKAKRARAEPVSALYEQERVGHRHSFPKLEDQEATYTGSKKDKSPDRHDALVWAFTNLLEHVEQPLLTIDPTIGHAGNFWSFDAS